ncbi:MAG: exosortase/archaeosortase family protein [Verrucomicrobia bacterium]|nr:exosortase/archaeosortase family protein [Verrucomicrobiota bacterium]
MTSEPSTSVHAGISLRDDFARCWAALPGKALFGLLLLVWLGLFQLQGNSTLGYVKTSSLFGWMNYAYQNSADDEHGYVIPLVVLALLWWKRAELVALPKRVWWPALALVALALVLHALGFIVQQTRVSIVAFFAGLWALSGLTWGAAWLRTTVFPFVLFAFCVPLGNSSEMVTFPLRLLATKITVALSHAVLGLNVIQNGTSIFDPAGRFQYEVAAACSGIRSLTAVAALATIYAFVNFRAPWKRAVVLASAFPLAIAANVLRLLCIVIAADAFGQSAGNYVHQNTWLSLLPYLPALAGLFLIGRWLREDSRPAGKEPRG